MTHMTVGLLRLLLGVMILTLVEIHRRDLEALLHHVAMAATVVVQEEAIVAMRNDHIRYVRFAINLVMADKHRNVASTIMPTRPGTKLTKMTSLRHA